MKKKNRNVVAILSALAFAAFFICLQRSNSSNAVLLKGNVEAISESANGNDPGGVVYLRTCFFSTKSCDGTNVFKCQDGTSKLHSGSSCSSNNTNFTMYGCVEQKNHKDKFLSEYGYCYIRD